MKSRRLIPAVLLAALAPAIVAQQPRLLVAKTLTLTVAADGLDGKLELLEDARLTPDLKRGLWGIGDPTIAFGEDSPQTKALANPPLSKAVLRLRDAYGKVLSEKTLEREMARIRFEMLHPDRRTILVTTDLSIGFGSYAGPSTELFQVSGGRIEPINARDAKTRETGPIELGSTLKTEWKLVPSDPGQVNQRDILLFACRPKEWSGGSDKFVRIYTRYHWNGAEWILFERRAPGFWEADEPFPAPQRFPGAGHPAHQ
jgi:hypothetical protein